MSLVQYIILRKDLQTVLNWPLGAIVAQACHASTAVLQLHKDDERTRDYVENYETMRKVVLETPDLASLTALAARLTDGQIAFHLWIEFPERIPTCIALKPYPRNEVKGILGEFKLFG